VRAVRPPGFAAVVAVALAVVGAAPAPAPAPAPAALIQPSMTQLRLRMGVQEHVGLYAPAMSRPDLLPVIFLAGDWGFRPLQQETASSLAREGRFVVGIDSTDYFRRPLEPPDWMSDLKRLREFTNEKAGRPADAPVLLLGFCWGGEVIPYMLNRGGAAGFAGAVLIGPDRRSAFIYRVSLQMDGVPSPPDESFDTGEELKRLPPSFPVAFIEGEMDKNSEARALEPLVRGPHKLATVPGADRQFHEVRDIYLSRLSQALAWVESQKTAAP
jgi:type IV secretory pathway VirJ component